MTPEEQNLDMLVAELDRENRLLRARNDRLEKEAEQRKPRVELARNERMSYEELEIDRDRMKKARDTNMLENANLTSENYELKNQVAALKAMVDAYYLASNPAVLRVRNIQQ
jgi:multidrug resistance efflux pump